MEDKGVTISIINNNPGLVIKADNEEDYLRLKSWAVPQFKAIREAYNNYVAPANKNPNTTVGEACPKCGKALVYKETPNGKKMMKCSGGKWNPMTKQTDGCDYVKWMNEPKVYEDNIPTITSEEPPF